MKDVNKFRKINKVVVHCLKNEDLAEITLSNGSLTCPMVDALDSGMVVVKATITGSEARRNVKLFALNLKE